MERETPEAAPPPTFLRGEEASSGSSSARARFERLIRRVQAEVCAALEAVEEGSSNGNGGGVFREDAWTRPGGGGGISRVLQGGRVFEKAAVNVSVVYGVMPPDAYRAARPDAAAAVEKAGPVPFFAAGVSSVIHPNNPFAPTLHFNYRYFETEAPQGTTFGGGTDLTPSYIIEEDIKHFHSVQKQACDKFDPTFYPRFKKWCDEYFHIKHRGERRGVGGIFFDDLSDHDQETLLDFAAVGDGLIRLRRSLVLLGHHLCLLLRRPRYLHLLLTKTSGLRNCFRADGVEDHHLVGPQIVDRRCLHVRLLQRRLHLWLLRWRLHLRLLRRRLLLRQCLHLRLLRWRLLLRLPEIL
ncbi:Coproporphyrinogen-III oxidase, chloroplastic [Hordeum vulgare]|nr:Coproporphyrinogen-III oxidase, chloroplastic [Hordeum vulgare]